MNKAIEFKLIGPFEMKSGELEVRKWAMRMFDLSLFVYLWVPVKMFGGFHFNIFYVWDNFLPRPFNNATFSRYISALQ